MIIGIASYCHAQVSNLNIKALQLTPSVTSPSPGQEVKITAQSFTENIDANTVIWSVDGKEVSRGIGLKEISVKAPTLGKSVKVTVTLVNSSGSKSSESITISSGSIDIIIETEGYKPPFFRGKIGPKYQNTVKIIAMPHLVDNKGVEYDPKTLIYKWSKNDRVVSEYSGYGKQFVEVQGSVVPRPYTVSLSVTSKDGIETAESIIFVEEQQAFVNMYENDPLYGPIFNKAITNSIGLGKEKEAKIIAIPFGFNRPDLSKGSLSFTWMVNNILKPEIADNDTIILRAPEGATGSSNISLEVRNKKDILQSANVLFRVVYGDNGASRNTTNTTGGPAF
jgi:hypothetical protein